MTRQEILTLIRHINCLPPGDACSCEKRVGAFDNSGLGIVRCIICQKIMPRPTDSELDRRLSLAWKAEAVARPTYTPSMPVAPWADEYLKNEEEP